MAGRYGRFEAWTFMELGRELAEQQLALNGVDVREYCDVIFLSADPQQMSSPPTSDLFKVQCHEILEFFLLYLFESFQPIRLSLSRHGVQTFANSQLF